MTSHDSSDLAPLEQEVSHPFETLRRHGVAELPELLSVIFSYLGRVELARAARVCKTWSPIALDYLWEHIYDLPELFSVYSSPRKRTMERLEFSFEDTSDGGRLDEFWAYARRIRTVSEYGDIYEPDVIPHLLRRVREAGYGQTFLPNLREITFTGFQGPEHFPQFTCIVPSIPATLESLSFKINTDISPETFMEILQALFSVSMKHLKSIELGTGTPTSAESNHLLATFLRHQQHLESLRGFSTALATEDVRYIGQLPSLIELDLYHMGANTREVERVCSAIADQFPNLRKLSLLNRWSRFTFLSTLVGLAPCRDLRAVTFTCTYPRAFDAEDIQTLGRAWPQLEKLCFRPYENCPGARWLGAPIKVLEDVALCWSETITTVSLIFHAGDGVPEPSEVKGRFKRLRTIVVDYCTIPDNQVHPVAEFIAAMCTDPPDVEVCDSRAETRGDWYAVQKEVRTIIERRQT